MYACIFSVSNTKYLILCSVPIIWNFFELHDGYNGNEIDSRVWGLKRLMGLKEHRDGFKLANVLEWHSVVASVR